MKPNHSAKATHPRMHSRRDFLRSAAAAGLAAGLVPGAGTRLAGARPGRRTPNLILILVDDLGWADLACTGSEFYETPNLDRLAREGMRFTNGYAACAVCSPTRAAIMTGRYPARTGVTDWIRPVWRGNNPPETGHNPTGYEGGPGRKLLCPENAVFLEHDEVTIPEALRPADYRSCHIGKWHLGPEGWYPEAQGFDENHGGCDYGQPPTYFDPYARPPMGGIPTLKPRREGEYLTDRESEEATAFIRRNADRPFFLYMAHYAVHTPIQAREELIRKYAGRLPGIGQRNPTYAAMVENVDQAVGRMLETLEEEGIDRDTLIVFTSDNGGLLGPTNNQPLRSGKGFPYEGGIREPFIVRWPGVVEPGAVCDEPVCSIDCLPTLCEAAGVGLPAGRAIDGASLMPLLRGEARSLNRDGLFWHFPHYRGGLGPYSIVRLDDWKLIKRWETGRVELFDLAADPRELNDLTERMPGQVRRLEERLDRFITETNARMPRPNPDYRG